MAIAPEAAAPIDLAALVVELREALAEAARWLREDVYRPDGIDEADEETLDGFDALVAKATGKES